MRGFLSTIRESVSIICGSGHSLHCFPVYEQICVVYARFLCRLRANLFQLAAELVILSTVIPSMRGFVSAIRGFISPMRESVSTICGTGHSLHCYPVYERICVGYPRFFVDYALFLVAYERIGFNYLRNWTFSPLLSRL